MLIKLTQEEIEFGRRIVPQYERARRHYRYLRWILLLVSIGFVGTLVYGSHALINLESIEAQISFSDARETNDMPASRVYVDGRLSIQDSKNRIRADLNRGFLFLLVLLVSTGTVWMQYRVEPLQVKLYRIWLAQSEEESKV